MAAGLIAGGACGDTPPLAAAPTIDPAPLTGLPALARMRQSRREVIVDYVGRYDLKEIRCGNSADTQVYAAPKIAISESVTHRLFNRL